MTAAITSPSRAATLLDRVPERIADAGPAWLVKRRRDAAARLRETGFPHKKVESWRFSPAGPVAGVPFAPAAFAEPAPGGRQRWADWLESRLDRANADAAWRLLLVNGHPAAPRAQPPDGVQVIGLADALADAWELPEAHLGRLAPNEYFGALNTALFEDGVLIAIAPGAAVERPIEIVHIAQPGAEPTAAYPRVLVVAGEGSSARLCETYLSAAGERQLTCPVTEVVLAAGAQLDHVRIQEGREGAYHVAHLAVHQDQDSVYRSHVASLGGALCRVDLSVVLCGEGAECRLDGVYHAGSREHVDHHTVIDHARPRCTSNEAYRGLIDGSGHAVFDGTIVVRRDSQRSSAHQENRNLLLSDGAVVNTKPHLTIDADDVTCSHGATIGALDDAQLFYLRARGIGEEAARAILTLAFVRSLVSRVAIEPARAQIERALAARVSGPSQATDLSGALTRSGGTP